MVVHQRTLLGGQEPAIAARPQIDRWELDAESWVDVAREWLVGADEVLDVLIESVDWSQGRRWMYERMVDDPRLSHWYEADAALPHPVLLDARRALERQYGVRFGSVGCNYYRDGNDSVAWHGDKIGRSNTEDTMIAIVSLGATRVFALRPKGGGKSLRIAHHHGDLLVMGGSCQRTWEHSIPKTTRPVGPRISIQFRPHDVR
jgi:alkylated DNA repair dioxygenase AlkB